MKRTVLIAIILGMGWGILYAQSVEKADRLFTSGSFEQAGAIYKKLLVKSPKYPFYNYRYARCLQETQHYEEALKYFGRSGEKYPLKYFFIGEIYMAQWKFEAAVESYNTYLQKAPQPNDREDYARKQIDKADKWQRYARRIEKVSMIDSVTIPMDSIYAAIRLSAECGQPMPGDEGHVYTNQRGDRQLWGEERDNKVLLMTRLRLLDKWGNSSPLPDNIQMSSRQQNPFLLSDGVTLYFASQASNGLGGLDLYVTRYNTATDSYTTPENLGFPYNSEANDYCLMMDETHRVGYMVSDRNCPKGKVKLFTFALSDKKEYWNCDMLSTDSLRAYAEWKAARRVAAPQVSMEESVPTPAQSVMEGKKDDAIYVIINDSTLYTSLQQFRSEKARELYIQWMETDKQYREATNRLEQLRKAYFTASSEEKSELKSQILSLETDKNRFNLKRTSLLKSVRQEEVKEL